MQNMRNAKERKRLANPKREEVPRMRRDTGLKFGLKDMATGDIAWVQFVSIRDVIRRLSVVIRYYLKADV